MSYRKRTTSTEVLKAQERNNKVKSIEPDFDLGNGLNPQNYLEKIEKVINYTSQYNTQLAEVDTVLVNLHGAEKDLADFSQRMLNAIGAKYGFDSSEYKKAGGTPKSDRKRTTKKSDNNNSTEK